jgi:hypothetical protein
MSISLNARMGMSRRSGSTVPAIFTDNQWVLAIGPDPIGDKLIVDLLTEPGNGGSPILRYEYRLNGGAAITLPGGTALGAREITVVLLTAANIEIRAVNAVSANPDNWSAFKTLTPQINGGTSSQTLTFDGAALSATGVVSFGTYADGSYWINGGGSAVTVTGITPASTTADRTISGGGTTGVTRVHGAMIDPGNAARYATGDVSTLALRQQKNYGLSTGDPGQGYDQFDAGTTNAPFVSSLNVDPGFTGSSIVLTQGTIVKAISKLSAVPSSARPIIDKLVPFTIVSTAPAANSFRPATALASKASLWTTADLNMARLPNLTPTGVTVPTYATVLAKLRYQSWQHTYNVSSRNIVGDTGGAPVYGGDFYEYTEAMLGLCYSTWTAPQKLEIAKLLVQLAIDIAGRAVEGGIWQDNGGHCTARKSLLTFAAFIMDDDPVLSAIIEYKALGANYGPKATPVGASIFGDDTQHLTITQAIINEARNIPYTQEQLGWPEWGGDATRDATSNLENHLEGDASLDPSNNKSYRNIQARVNAPAALALRLMGAKDLFNNQTFFDYADRHMTARIDNGGELQAASGNDISPWVLAAWQLSRGTLGLWPASEFFTVAILGQSSPFYITTGDSAGGYNSALIPRPTSISTQTSIMVDRAADAPRERQITDATVAARQINMGIVVLADLFGWAVPERKLVFKQMARSGTGRAQYMDDTETERLGSVDDAIANYKTAEWGDVDLVFEIWRGNDDPTFPNFGREWSPLYMKQRWGGSAFTKGTPNPDSVRNPTDNVDRHFWDVTVPENQRGTGLWTRNTKLVQMPDGGSANYAGFDAFHADTRVQTFASRAPGEWNMYQGSHPLTTTPDGQVYAGWTIAPSIANALGIPVVQPTEYRVEVGPSGAYADIFVKLPNGGNLTTFRINESRAAPSPFLPHQQQVTGVDIRRVGDTTAQRQPVFRLSETSYPSKYRGTVTLHNAGTGTPPSREGVIRVTPLDPFVDGDMLYLMWQDTTSPAKPGGSPYESTSQPWLDYPVETVPSLVNPAALYKYPGIAIRWHMPPLLLGPPVGGALTNVVAGNQATWDGTPVATNEIAGNLAEWN